MAMRFTVSYAPRGYKMKMKLPASWTKKEVVAIKDLFADKLAKDTGVAREEVDVSCYHVVDAAGRALSNDTIIAAALKDYDEISICDGPAPAVTAPLTTSQLPPTSSAAGAGEARVGSGGVTCRNFGCMKSYSEADNHDAACVHHAGPPVFHEGKKCWSCCRDKLAWDWEEFMAIPGCVTSAHSNVPPAVSTPVAASPSTDAAADTPTPTPIKSIADYNAANPDAPTAVTSLVKTLSTAKTKLVVREDGKKRCVHFGCQQFFSDDENSDSACRYHLAGPVFHEGAKYWGCCPSAKHLEFDAFLAQPGCQTGPHEAGTEA